MASIFVTVTIALVVLYCILYYFKRNKYKLPPGPKSLPILGYLPFVGNHPHITFKQLSLKYGNIFSLRLGLSQVVVLNDYTSAKEAFNNPFILHRQPGIFDFHPGSFGFTASNDADWIEQRRHCMRFLKEYGLSNVKWQEDVIVELEDFIKMLAEYSGKPVDVCSMLSVGVANNMLSLVLGRRIPTGDPQKNLVSEAVDAVADAFNPARITSIFPKLAIFFAKIGISSLAEEYRRMYNLNKLLIKEVESRRKASYVRDEIFIDTYMGKIKQLKESNIKTTLNEHNLVGNMQTLIYGGSETTRTSLQWLFLAMAAFPEIQRKVQKEIDQVLGPEGKCVISDRNRLPYTFATIMECQRWRTVAPLGLVHMARENTTIGEFSILKGTNVIANIWALHNDSNYWKEPKIFEPKRFLLENGTLNTKEPDSYIPFSIGRRNCPGKLIALMEIFKYFQGVLQKFVILPLEDQPPILSGTSGITYYPYPQKLRFKLRE